MKSPDYAKVAAGWRCQHCQLICLRLGGKHPALTRSEWTKATLSVPERELYSCFNQPENLIPLCTPCHLALHCRTKRSNVSPGQLSRSVNDGSEVCHQGCYYGTSWAMVGTV